MHYIDIRGNYMTIKVTCINGAWYGATETDTENLQNCELDAVGGYLSFKLLRDHVIGYGYDLVEDNIALAMQVNNYRGYQHG